MKIKDHQAGIGGVVLAMANSFACAGQTPGMNNFPPIEPPLTTIATPNPTQIEVAYQKKSNMAAAYGD